MDCKEVENKNSNPPKRQRLRSGVDAKAQTVSLCVSVVDYWFLAPILSVFALRRLPDMNQLGLF